ncbi:hypothetical protein QUF61_02685 [Candidatus Venteria ishoeyi]|uniref:hypothetical protein n=1 Tax=Candidatus Venteria ishoeyi TaxID=1899563 RepID=UPI0025A66132|nr:hypothetical protein [Candidatus Venteria ishoeyi]MDM8545378.1 hypothetical protein [Candidatus Venteria ishoeyi]
MELSAVQYISDKQGHTTGVVVPIELWQRIQKMMEEKIPTQEVNAWDTLQNLTGSLSAPSDWAEEHDHYLYGTNKQKTKQS